MFFFSYWVYFILKVQLKWIRLPITRYQFIYVLSQFPVFVLVRSRSPEFAYEERKAMFVVYGFGEAKKMRFKI